MEGDGGKKCGGRWGQMMWREMGAKDMERDGAKDVERDGAKDVEGEGGCYSIVMSQYFV